MAVDVIFPKEEEDMIDQSEKVGKETAQHMGQMGWLFDNVHNKLGFDKTCYECKKEFVKDEKIQILNATGSPKGSVMFVSICEDCFKKLEELNKKAKEKAEKKEPKVEEKLDKESE